MTIRKKTGRGGADAVARNAEAGERAEISRRGAPPASLRYEEEDKVARTKGHGPRRKAAEEVLRTEGHGPRREAAEEALRTKDSNFGTGKYPVRPTAEERASIPAAASVPDYSAPSNTGPDDANGAFKGENHGVGVKNPEIGRG